MSSPSDELRRLRWRAAEFFRAPDELPSEAMRGWAESGSGEASEPVTRLLELLMVVRAEGERAGIEAWIAFERAEQAESVWLAKQGTRR